MMKEFKLKGHIAALGANMMWGMMAPIAKLVMAASVITPLLLTNFRIVGAALLFWAASIFCPKEKVTKGDLLRLAGAGMLGIVLNQGCYVFGVGSTSPGEASIITTTMPIWVLLLATLILKEPLTWKKGGGIAMGAFGALLLILGGARNPVRGDNPLLGDILVLTAQFCYALYLTLYRNFIKKYSVVTLMKWMFTFASIAILPISINTWLSTEWCSVKFVEIAGIFYVVFFATFIAYICTMVAQKNLRPTVVGIYNYAQPVTASLIGIYLGLDRFTLVKLVAVLFIFSGVYLVTISKAAPEDNRGA